jgi:hypothetical protein
MSRGSHRFRIVRNGRPVDVVVKGPNAKSQGLAMLQKAGYRVQRNVEMGYRAGGKFHPVRYSSDYDPSRVGEKRPRTIRRARTRRNARRAPLSKAAFLERMRLGRLRARGRMRKRPRKK